MRRPITVFVYFLPAAAILLHSCTYQGPVKEIITEKRIIRANTYMQGGNYEDAITDYTKAVEINPKDAFSYNNRGIAYYDRGDYDRTCSDFKKSCELGYCKGLNWVIKEGVCNQ